MKKKLQVPVPSFKLRLSIAMAVLLITAEAFRWNIVDIFTPLVAGPLLAMVWGAAWFSAIYIAVNIIISRHEEPHSLLPLAVSIGALLAATLLPFTQLWLRINFELKREAREQLVQKVRSGELSPNVKHDIHFIRLAGGSGLSMGGDEIVVDGPPGQQSVLFYTYRGFLDAYSGFVWVPSERKPEQFLDADEPNTEIVQFDKNWYYIGHR